MYSCVSRKVGLVALYFLNRLGAVGRLRHDLDLGERPQHGHEERAGRPLVVGQHDAHPGRSHPAFLLVTG